MAEPARRSQHLSDGAARRGQEDAALLARAAKRDLGAFAALYRRFSGSVCALALRITRNRAEAEEVTQEVFWRVWQLASRFDPARGSVAAWVLSVARNRALDLVRARNASRRTFREPEPNRRPAAPLTPEGELEWLEWTHRIQRVLERLPPPQREVLDLAYWGGLSHIEIAECTGTPLGTVKSRIALAIARLRKALAGGETVQPIEAPTCDATGSRPAGRVATHCLPRPASARAQRRAEGPRAPRSAPRGVRSLTPAAVAPECAAASDAASNPSRAPDYHKRYPATAIVIRPR